MNSSSARPVFPESMDSGGRSVRTLDWAAHLDWMEGLEPVAPRQKQHPRWQGLVVACLVALASLWLGKASFWPFTLPGGVHPLDAVLLAMLLGMVVGNFWPQATGLRAGMNYGAKVLLPVGIVLLGARLDFAELLRVGGIGIALSIACVITALLLTYCLVAPLFGVGRRFGFLLGVGSAVCGGTAIVAIAPVVRAKEEEVVLGVASVTLVGLVAMLIMPLIAASTHLSQMVYGVWAGLTIHQTPQVIAAGFAYGPTAGEAATVIKLARVCLLAPLVVCASFFMARSEGIKTRFSWNMVAKSLPLFVLGFIAMAAARSLGLLPEVHFNWKGLTGLGMANADFSVREEAINGATFLLALGMAGVGWETRFSTLLKAGWKPLVITMLVSILLGAASFVASSMFFGA